MWLSRGQLSADVTSPWYFHHSEWKLSKRLLIRITGLHLGVYTAFLDLAMGITGPIAGFIVGKFGYSAVFLCGSGAAGCAFVLTLLLYHLVREPHAGLSRKTLEPLETGETR